MEFTTYISILFVTGVVLFALLVGLVTWRRAKALSRSKDVDALLREMEHGGDLTRQAAARALGRSGDPRAVPALIEALATRRLRSAATDALGQLGPLALEPLCGALEGPRPVVRAGAATALGRIGDVRALDPLVSALDDRESGVRANAAAALGKLGEPAVEALLGVLDGGDRDVQVQALIALTFGASKGAGEELRGWTLRAVVGEDELSRTLAFVVLGHIADARLVHSLLDILDDESVRVREYAGRALGHMGAAAEEALEPLRRAQAEGKGDFRRAIRNIERALQAGPRELMSAPRPEGTGTEPEASGSPEGRGTEPEAADAPEEMSTEPETAGPPDEGADGKETSPGEP